MTFDEKQHMDDMAKELANRSLFLIIVETSLFVVIALVALLGNACVLYVFYKTPRLRTITSYYIITLAISDIAMAVLVIPSVIAVSACGCDALGFVAGSIIQWILTVLLFGSLQTTSLIAINRYFCVVKPSLYRKHFRPKSSIFMIVGCWIINLVPIIAIFTSGITTIDFYASRYMRFPYFIGPYTGRIITALYQVLFTIFPATLSIICYWKIHQQVKSHKASLGANRITNITSLPVTPNRKMSVVPDQISSLSFERNRMSSSESNPLPSLQVAGNQTSSSAAQISPPSLLTAPNPSPSSSIAPNRTAAASNRTSSVSVQEIKLTKSLMVIVIGFCVCWLPSSTVLHLSAYIDLPRLVEALLIYCGFASNAINPILYHIYNRPFRRRALQLLPLLLRRVVMAENMVFSSNRHASRTTGCVSELDH